MRLKDRVDRFIEEYPKHGYKVKPAAIAAGYGKGYAHADQKKIMKAAGKRIEEYIEEKSKTDLRKLDAYWDIEELKGEYGKILKQDKDYSTKEKAIRPILQKHGILPKEETEIKAPTLILGIRELNVSLSSSPPSEGGIEGKETILESGEEGEGGGGTIAPFNTEKDSVQNGLPHKNPKLDTIDE